MLQIRAELHCLKTSIFHEAGPPFSVPCVVFHWIDSSRRDVGKKWINFFLNKVYHMLTSTTLIDKYLRIGLWCSKVR